MELSNPPLFYQETISVYVPIAPASLSNVYAHICAERFSPLLLSYYPPVRGIVLSYSNVRLSSTSSAGSNANIDDSDLGLLAKSADEYSASFLWATVDLLVYRIQKGAWLEGRVKLQTETHVTISHLNALTAYISRDNIPASWKWIADPAAAGLTDIEDEGSGFGKKGGYYVDQSGQSVDERTIQFQVKDTDMRPRSEKNKGFMRIVGSLSSEGGHQDQDVEMEDVAGPSVEKHAQRPTETPVPVPGSIGTESTKEKKKEKKNKNKKKRKGKDKDGLKTQSHAIEVS